MRWGGGSGAGAAPSASCSSARGPHREGGGTPASVSWKPSMERGSLQSSGVLETSQLPARRRQQDPQGADEAFLNGY